MSDLISRQDAIEAVAELASSMSVCISVDECHGMKRMQGMAVRVLDDLPSVQPQSTMGQVNEAVQSTKDCISRQAAIDALKGLSTWWADEGGYYGGAQPPMVALLDPEDAVSAIENMPSAQPEIVKCRECKHYQFADNRAFGMPVKMCEWFGFEDVDDDDFCSRAERRTE